MSNHSETLKANLKRIKANNYQLNDGENVMDYVHSMLHYIGDTDPELRDDLIYSTFCSWICEEKYFKHEELTEILTLLIDEKHLFYNIGSDEDDSVFTRTFSVLVIDVLLYWNRKNPYIPNDSFNKIKDSLIKYYSEEKDLRGYLDHKGWAHAAAHGADALCELAQSNNIEKTDLMAILNGLQLVLFNGKYLLNNEEDERMACVVFIMIMKNLLPRQRILGWIESIGESICSDYSHEQYVTQVNTKNFIRSLYFSLMHQQNTSEFTDILFKTEEKLNKFIQIGKELVSR